MTRTRIDRDLRDDLLKFLGEVSSKADNLETRRKAFGLILQLKPKRIRKTKIEYDEEVKHIV